MNLSPNPVAELDLIIKELPTSIFTLNYDKLKTIQKIFQFTYEVLDLPLIKEMKIERVIAAERARVDYERLSEERRELTKRIGIDRQSKVSHQRMGELFGEQALKMKNKWGKLGITFFDADNQIERQSALREAASLKAAWNSLN